jgi:hypothetical protein
VLTSELRHPRVLSCFSIEALSLSRVDNCKPVHKLSSYIDNDVVLAVPLTAVIDHVDSVEPDAFVPSMMRRPEYPLFNERNICKRQVAPPALPPAVEMIYIPDIQAMTLANGVMSMFLVPTRRLIVPVPIQRLVRALKVLRIQPSAD